MDESSSYFDPDTVAKIQGLQLRAQHVVEGYVSGVHRSPFHGFSIEFAEHREYAPGDDLRYVDWKVYAKRDKYYLKQYEEETNLISYLVLDTSESMGYRGPDSPMSKLDYGKTIAASLAYLILQQQDSVGLVTFDSEVRSFVRAAAKASHLRQILHVLESSPGERKTGAGPIFHELAERMRRRGVVLVISDFLDDVPSLLAGLKHFRYRRHEVILFHLVDRAEMDFPFRKITKFQGLEGLPDVLTEPRALRNSYLEEMGHFLKELKTGCRAQRADYRLVRTDQPIDVVLSSFLAPRMTKVR